MPGFNAAEVVEPLEWDFTKYDAGKGTVPEPSDKDIETLFRDLTKVSKDVMEKAGVGKLTGTPEQVMAAIAELDDSAIGITQMISGFTKAFAKLCKNQPTAIQLNKLPLRVRMAFYVWLADELRPEVGGGVSMPPLNGLRIGQRA